MNVEEITNKCNLVADQNLLVENQHTQNLPRLLILYTGDVAQQSAHDGSPNAEELQIHIGRALSDAKSELQIRLGVVDIIDRVLDVFLGSTLQDLLHLLAHQDLKLFQINEDVP